MKPINLFSNENSKSAVLPQLGKCSEDENPGVDAP
jgi:hypothetical protein